MNHTGANIRFGISIQIPMDKKILSFNENKIFLQLISYNKSADGKHPWLARAYPGSLTMRRCRSSVCEFNNTLF